MQKFTENNHQTPSLPSQTPHFLASTKQDTHFTEHYDFKIKQKGRERSAVGGSRFK